MVVRNSGELSSGNSWLFGCFTIGDGCSSVHQNHNTYILLNIIVSHLQNKSGTTQTTFNSTTGIRSGSFTYETGKTCFGQFTIANFTPTFIGRRKGSTHVDTRSHPSRWKDFVGNRVALIQELIPTAHWRHVPGAENPADWASHGLLTSQLREHQLWWHGLSWLCKDESAWPSQANSIEDNNLPEMRAKVTLTAVTSNSTTLGNLIDQYSSLTQLIRVTGWVMFACERFKAKGNTHHESKLTADLISKTKLF